MYKMLKIFAVVSTIGLFLVILMGALVTKTGSGEGCGDSWPLCNGEFTPAGTIQSTIEYSHRAVSGAVGLMVSALAIWAWRVHRGKRDIAWLAVIGVGFIFIQAGLGAAAVMWSQSDTVLALHFGISLISFAGVLLLTLRIFQYEHIADVTGRPVSKKFSLAVWGLLIYTYLVVYLGAYVIHSGSSMGCTGWPSCNGEWLPSLTGITGIAFAHRVAALFVVIGVGLLAWVARRDYPDRKDIHRGSLIAFVLVVLQLASGALVVLTELSLFGRLLHATFICLFFGTLVFVGVQANSKRYNIHWAEAKNI